MYNFPCTEKLAFRMKDGLGSTRYKPVDYHQLRVFTEAKKLLSANIERKIQKTVQAAKMTKEQTYIKQHRQVWCQEQKRLMKAEQRADFELLQFLEHGTNSEFLSEMMEYELNLEEDRKAFKAGTVDPIVQLKNDLQHRLSEVHHNALQNMSDCDLIQEQVEFVKEQQKDIIEKLKCEIQAAEESISVTGTEELLSSLEVIPSDLEQIPKQVLLLRCPYPDLKASLLNEFQTFGNKYKFRLQNINEQLKALDSGEHIATDLAELKLYIWSDHERSWDWYRFTVEQQKSLVQGWIRDKKDLQLKAVATLDEACMAYEEEIALKNDRRRQQEICAELKDKLEHWRAQQEEMARLEAAIADRKQAEEEEKQKKENLKCIQKRSLEKEKIKQYYTEKQMMRNEMEKRDQQRLEELKKSMAEQAKKDRERVQFRQCLHQQRVKEKEVQALQLQQEEEERQSRLNILRNQVAVVAEFDPVRMMSDTEASKARLGIGADEEFVLQRPLFNLHTYSENQIVSDPRVRIEQALREAGLHNTFYAKEVLSNICPPRPPRRDMESTVFQT
ncbi:Coiled-coil domain-containing protein 148 [Acipenser ruthenus]|uniref:Coiled-coil domain-containing protein 148 n=1 Tax=Acipenser ruthenus TaxID=7906 RepID=A0A444U8R6_ACIRT|nr:Coiled-coil domain-containing protein 148 [Acipenser ruthenus]